MVEPSRKDEQSGLLSAGDSPLAGAGALARLFDVLPTAVLVLDRRWQILFANPAAAQLVGYERTELVGAPLDRLIPEELRQRYLKIREGSLETQAGAVWLHGERIARTKDGRDMPVEVSLARMELDGVELHAVTLVDITRQKALEQETIEQLHSIVEHTEANIFLIEVTPDGAFQFETLNPVGERLVGLKSEQVRGRTPEQLMPPEEARRVTANYRRCVELGVPMTYEESPGPSAGGRTFRTTLVPVEDAHGRVHRLVGLAHDITDQKQAEHALATARARLHSSEEKFRKAFRASPHPITITELETGRLLEVNEAFERVFGYAREAVLGKTTVELGLWKTANERLRTMETLGEQSSFHDLEVEGGDRLGRSLSLSLSGELIEIDGHTCLVTYIHDLTERQREQVRAERARAELEQQLRQVQKMEELGTLAGGIAHDFNNILAAMLAYAELIRVDIDDPVQINEHLRELKAASDRAKELVRQILTFSRRQPQQRQPIRLDATVREALRLLRSTLPAMLAIEVEVEPDTPVVLADSSQVHQVLLNLGTNAAHAVGKARGGKLNVRLEGFDVDAEMARIVPELQERRYARLTVSDTGRGMTPATRKRIFEPFFTTKPIGEGTGLGLAVAHGIVREHDGAIVVDSELGKGTTFSLYFPEYHADLAQAAAEAKNPLARGAGESVLLVDDEVALCRSLSSLLEKLDYRVLACSDPDEAVARFRDAPHAFRLLLTDLTMPTMSGIELARKVHEIEPRLPIVAMTGFSGMHTSESLQALGIGELILKPLNARDLALVLRRALESQRG